MAEVRARIRVRVRARARARARVGFFRLGVRVSINDIVKVRFGA